MVADVLEMWMEEADVDGFNTMRMSAVAAQ
jgi:hypothetical protein